MAKHERNARWLKLYKQGHTDDEIAEVEKSTKQIVACWRNRNKLPVNTGQKPHLYLPDETKAVWLYLHGKGLSDKEIADIEGCKVKVVMSWRMRNKLPPKRPFKTYLVTTPEIKARWLNLYKQGLTDKEIAEKEECNYYTVTRWRKGLELPINMKPRKNNTCNETL